MKRSVALIAFALAACEQAPPPTKQEAKAAGPAPGTSEWKIQNAMSAAPASIASAATIMDWPMSPKDTMKQLRAGANGWVCFPDVPDTPGTDPMCFDKTWQAWAAAWMGHKPVVIKEIGIGYMLQGGSDASNTDPFKMKPDSGQQWVNSGPHVMVLTPNLATLAALPTDYKTGGPWVMWSKTPYAHIMVPAR